MAEPGEKRAERLKVFVSYSRADLAFADELAAGLDVMGFEPLVDRTSIREGEDWKRRLGGLIADAGTVVFVLSPDSAKSPVCAWEVEEAAKLSKRILPVLWRPLDGTPPPERLAALNYTRASIRPTTAKPARSWPGSRRSPQRSTPTSTGCASTRGCCRARWNGSAAARPTTG